MYCSHCGSEVEAGARFCQNCGASVDVTNTEEKVSYEPIDLTETIEDQVKDQLAGSILTNGILSLVFSIATVFLSFIGIIFGAIGKSKAKEFESKFGELSPKARVGKILSGIGFGVGIGFTVFWALYIVFIVVIVLATLGA